MPTKRRRRLRHVAARVAPALVHLLRTGELPPRESDRDGILTAFVHLNSGELRDDWLAVRDELLAAWIQEHPGTRPHGWWLFDAPQEPVAGVTGAQFSRAAQRRRVGGVGIPAYEVLNYAPRFDRGIPIDWLTPSTAAYFNLQHAVPDPTDPPQFESEAAYLERHRLLEPSERRRLRADAFEPETVSIDMEDEHAA